MKKTLPFIIFSLSIFVLTQSGIFAADKQTTWRFATFASDKRPEWKLMEAHSNFILKNTSGQLKIVLYPGLSLGVNPMEALRTLRRGRIEMSLMMGSIASRDEPLFGILTPQGVWNDPSDIKEWRLTLNKIKKELYQKWGIVSGGDVFSPMDLIYAFTNKPIRRLDDLKGMKIRVWAPDMIKTLRKLGIIGQMIPRHELYLALKTGVVDGCLFAPVPADALSVAEVAKYATPIYVYTSELPDFAISKKVFDNLPADQQKQVLEGADFAIRYCYDNFYGHKPIMSYIKSLEKDGVTFLPRIPEEDRLRFQQAALEVWEADARKLGPKGIKYYKILKASLEK